MLRVEVDLRNALYERSGGWCEANLQGCLEKATQLCHRVARKMGGRPKRGDLRLSNVWHGCSACHGWATERPREAYDLGLALREHQDPANEPMVRRGVLTLLDDDGTVLPV